jgi:predicted component of type VI protein secretion system
LVSSPTPIRFDVYRGEQLLHSETIAELIIKIGSATSSHLRLEDEAASRLHAMIEVNALGEIHIADLGSRTGTFVNGEKSQRARLQSGDEVRIGDTRIVVAMRPPAPQPGGDLTRSAQTSAHASSGAGTRVPPDASPVLGASAAPAPTRRRRAPLLILVAVLLALLAAFVAYQAARAQPHPVARRHADASLGVPGDADHGQR